MNRKLNRSLKERRVELGLTQSQVAKKSNMEIRNYQRIENEGQEPRVFAAILLADALDSTVKQLFSKSE